MKSATRKNVDYFHFGGIEKVRELIKEHPNYKLIAMWPNDKKFHDATIEQVERALNYYWDNLVSCDHEFKEIRVSSSGLIPGGDDSEYEY